MLCDASEKCEFGDGKSRSRFDECQQNNKRKLVYFDFEPFEPLINQPYDSDVTVGCTTECDRRTREAEGERLGEFNHGKQQLK